ncbi:MAG TPA: dihydrofolate reductase family protein [Tepidiformaceae bacterium]|nr:dihydrofolate reductase family protein [Tepidiformaceae bacterium]
MPRPDYTSLDLPPPPDHRPYVLMNMVMSADGKVVIEGTEQGIGSKTDQRLMRQIRVNADVVVNGASTLRASGASPRLGDSGLEELRLGRGLARYPVGAVISRSGELPLDRIFFTATDFEAVVYLSEVAPLERRKQIAATGRRVFDMPAGMEVEAMLRHMRQELGARVLLVEGGPTLNSELFHLDAVDEYFVTIGPVIVSGDDMLTAVEGPRPFTRETAKRLELLSAVPNEETSEVYLRYRIRR